MHQRFCHPPEYQPNPDAAAKEHCEPLEIAEFRFVIIFTEFDFPVFGEGDIYAKEYKESNHQEVKPTEVIGEKGIDHIDHIPGTFGEDDAHENKGDNDDHGSDHHRSAL